MENYRLPSKSPLVFKNHIFVVFILVLTAMFFALSFLDVEAQTNRRTTRETETNIRDTVINLEDLNPLGKGTTIESLIDRIVKWLVFYIGPSIVTLMIILGAFQIMAAGGNPEKIKKGKQIVTYAIIGYALLLLSSGIISILKEVLGAK